MHGTLGTLDWRQSDRVDPHARAHKVLSKSYNVELAKRVRAEIIVDTSLGAHGRKERADETCVEQDGHALRAHPWQDSSTLSLSSHEMLLHMV